MPGPDGPIDCPRYEVVADAMDDYRYVATLADRLEKAKASGGAAQAAAAGRKALDELLSATKPYPTNEDYGTSPRKARNEIAGRSLDEWRDVLAQHIAAIDAAL